MAERDDTDELPPVAPPADRTERVPTEGIAVERTSSDEATTTLAPRPRPRRGGSGAASAPTDRADRSDRGDRGDGAGRGERIGRFGPARRRALLWNAGHGLVSGLVLLVLWAADRPVDDLPSWASVAAGIAYVLWAGLLAAAASGGVGRPATALVAACNLFVGGAVLALGWFSVTVPTLVVVVAAQVVGLGVVQLLSTVRR